MKPIRIISPQFELLGEIDDYESLQLVRRWYKPGEFELHININKNNTEVLQEDNILILGTDPKKVMIIRHREIKLDDQGKKTEELIIRGSTLSGITNRRITLPPSGQGYDRIKSNAESVIKHYVDTNCINPTDAKRKFSQLILSANLSRGTEVPWQTRYEQLDAVLQEIAEWCDIGWDIYLDTLNKSWVFDVFEGKNLSISQSINPSVVFSTEFDNIKSQGFINSSLNYKNVGYAGGQGEEEQRLMQQIGDAEGLARLETFLDCSDSADVTELLSNGQQKLNEFKKVQSFEGQVLNTGPYMYGEDYDLGDIVTVQNRKWGVTMDTRITEAKEVYEASGANLELTFGNSAPTLVEKLKQEFKLNSTPIRR